MDTGDFNLAQSTWSLLASGLGALLAGIFGVSWQFRRLRKERAFEKQVNWYHELNETIISLRNRSSVFEYYRTQPHMSGSIPDLIEDLGKLSFRFQELAQHSAMYARRDTHQKISLAVQSLNSLGKGFNVEDPEHQRSVMNASMDILSECSTFLARDMRALLDLEPL